MGVIGDFLIGVVIGCILIPIIWMLIEGFGGDNIAIKGSDKYNKYNQDADEYVSNILKNGSGSSKEELQEWWDKYH